MNFFKTILLLALLACPHALLAMEATPAALLEIDNRAFFYQIYPGDSSPKNPDQTRQLMAMGQAYFMIADRDHNTIKTCQTRHQKIIHAFYDGYGKYIITTASNGIVDIYDAECSHLFSLTDNNDGIHVGIFGKKDNKLVVITNSKSNNNLSKVWAIPGITNPARL